MPKVLAIVLFCAMIGNFLVACQPSPTTVPRPSEAKAEEPQAKPVEIEVPKVTMFSDTVCFFPQTKDEFAKNLVWYLKQHPDLEVVTVAPDVETGREYAAGYFVIFKKKTTVKESTTNEVN